MKRNILMFAVVLPVIGAALAVFLGELMDYLLRSLSVEEVPAILTDTVSMAISGALGCMFGGFLVVLKEPFRKWSENVNKHF